MPRSITARFCTLLATACIALTSVLLAAEAPDPATLATQLKATGEGRAPFADHFGLAKDLQKLGPAAVPHLLPLLQHEHGVVRYVAAFTLADCDGLTDEHLDSLITAYRTTDETMHLPVPVAIANVGTPRAVEFLIEELLHVQDASTAA